MKREDLVKAMKESIGTKEPIEYFSMMVDLLNLVFDRMDQLEEQVKKVGTVAVSASHWDPRLASNMILAEVQKLRESTDDKTVWVVEINALKQAYAEDKVTQNYEDFINFWKDTLGYHPFLD